MTHVAEPATLTPVMTKPEFLRWIEAPERRRLRFEWVEGRVVQQANVTPDHSLISANFLRLFGALLDIDEWFAHLSDIYVEQNGSFRLPDVIVERAGGDGRARSILEPVILVEVLSDTSIDRDFVEKLAEYPGFATLEAYIIASHVETKCWLWQRGRSGRFLKRATIVKGRDAALGLRGRGISLPMAEIYRNVSVA